MNNIILTGERGIGKSTLTDKVITASGLKAAGLKTLFKEKRDESHALLYACGWGTEPLFDENHIIARFGSGFPNPDNDVFNTLCAGLVDEAASSAEADIIVIDELGFLEKNAQTFRDAVLRALKCPKPVLAVIRQGLPGWTAETVKLGEVLEVKMDNRDWLPGVLMKKLAAR